MSKPTTKPRWAGLADGTPAANITAPTSGKMDTGWQNNDPAVSSYLNHLGYWTWRWIEWVDAGEWETSTLHVDLGLTVAGSVEIDVDLSVGGDVEVTGTVEAADVYHTAQVTLRVNAASATPVASGGPTYAAGGWIAGTSTGQLWYPLSGLRTDERIKSWTFFLTKGSASGTVTATLVRLDSVTGGSTTIGSAQTISTAGAGNVVLGEIGLDEHVTGDTSYAVVVTGGGTAGDSFRDVQVNVTRPAP